MAITLDQTIEQKQQSWLAAVLGSQTFWVLVAVILACIFLSFATDSFATAKNLYNITRNVTFVAIIALGMTMVIITGGIDLSVGSVLCLCSMVLAVVMHAGYSIEVGIAASIGTALRDRSLQRRADRLSGLPAVRRHARHAVDRAQPGDGRVQQYRRLSVRTGSRQASGAGRRRVVLRHRQPGALHDRAGAVDRLRAALDQIRPLCLRHRRQ